MPNPPDISTLQAGDVLLYRPAPLSSGVGSWFFGKVIALKTWTRVSHVEIYIGNGQSVASRDGLGVAIYPLRTAQLGYVLRTNLPVDLAAALTWFRDHAQGQKYDWKGLLVFSLAVKQGSPNKMYCSEFAARWLRDGCQQPAFGSEWDSDRTPPSLFLASLGLHKVWDDGGQL